MPLTTVTADPDPEAVPEDADDACVPDPDDDADDPEGEAGDASDVGLEAELADELVLDAPDSEPPEQADSTIAVAANSAAAAVAFFLAFMKCPVLLDDRRAGTSWSRCCAGRLNAGAFR